MWVRIRAKGVHGDLAKAFERKIPERGGRLGCGSRASAAKAADEEPELVADAHSEGSSIGFRYCP